MDPGTLHAVLSHNNSAIAGWEYVDADWLKATSIPTPMVKSAGLWEARIMRKRIEGAGGVYGKLTAVETSPKNSLDVLHDGLEM
jgi:hypothetical protein